MTGLQDLKIQELTNISSASNSVVLFHLFLFFIQFFQLQDHIFLVHRGLVVLVLLFLVVFLFLLFYLSDSNNSFSCSSSFFFL